MKIGSTWPSFAALGGLGKGFLTAGIPRSRNDLGNKPSVQRQEETPVRCLIILRPVISTGAI
jgi:hypothetical protein